MDEYHLPVLRDAVVEYLDPQPGETMLDGTLGGGGHAEALLEHPAQLQLIGVDRDPEALAVAKKRLARFGDRLQLVKANFADAFVASNVTPGTLNGVLLDLGVSSRQLDADARGFSFRTGAPLDMRMAETGRTAAELLNEESEESIAHIFWAYGDERRSRRIAHAIVERRATAPLATSDDLMAALFRAMGHLEGSDKARLFQAVRIAVNDELGSLERVLDASLASLAPGGRVAVIAYHSLEDRIVKNRFRDWSTGCTCPPGLPVCVCGGIAKGETLLRKPMSATADEIEMNPRARSAHLRVWRKS